MKGMRAQLKAGQVSPWAYAIIQAARQAHKELCCGRPLTAIEKEQRLGLLRCGQSTLKRLESEGSQFPEIDLSYPRRSALRPAQ